MQEEAFTKILQSVLQVGGGGALLFAIGQWFLKDWLKKGEKLHKADQERIDLILKNLEGQVENARAVVKDAKIEISAMKDRMLHTERLWIQGFEKLNVHSERIVQISGAFKEFVKTLNERISVVEKHNEQVFRIGRAMAARIKGSKTGTGEDK